MNEGQMSAEAVEFGLVTRAALREHGGFDLVMRCAGDPELRTREIEPLLQDLGVFDLDPLGDETQFEAAACVCRSVGTVALPYPVAERLSRPMGTAITALALAFDTNRINMGDVPLQWALLDQAGDLRPVTRTEPPLGSKLGAFVTTCELGSADPAAPELLPLALNLTSFTLLGILESAFEVTLKHVRTREQFGVRLVTFQAVQYQLVDALVAIQSFEQQANYALWSLARRRRNSLVDAAGARVIGLQAADVVLRTAHQLHGATGFCDESPISWLSRHSQPLRRLPCNGSAAAAWFSSLVLQHGFDGLFSSKDEGLSAVTETNAAAPNGHDPRPLASSAPLAAEIS